MAIDFSGSPTVSSSITFGTLTFPIISGGANTSSVRTRIREALAYGIKNNITKSNGYFNDIGEVNVNAVANNSGRKAWPSIDIRFLPERYTNRISGGNSQGGYNKIARVLLDCHLFEENCSDNPENIVRKRENIVADIEKYFGINHIIPDSLGNRTAFNCILVSNADYGIAATEPFGSQEIELEIYYRIELADPTQDF